MVESMQNAFTCVHLNGGGFRSVAEYVDFRRENVAAA